MTLTDVNPVVLNEVSELHPTRKLSPMAVTPVNPEVSSEVSKEQRKRNLFGKLLD